MRCWSAAALVWFGLGLGPVRGEEPPASAETSAPPGWHLPPPKVQLEMDPELIPVNRGAVFVPAMSESSAEPPYLVMQGEKVVTRTPCGKKTLLAPGQYTVLVGSGVESQLLWHSVDIHEGHATMVDPDWAGLVVRVVDQVGFPFRGTYEIFGLPGGIDFGLGLGADESRGEKLRTWLLPPGRYMIVAPGETPRARKDFITVRLLPGELSDVTVVQYHQKEDDPRVESAKDEGSFLGGGEIDRYEGKTEIKRWRLGLTLGGDLLWNRNDNVLGRDFGNSISLNLFTSLLARYLDPKHLVYLRVEVDQGQTAQPGGSLIKTVDDVALDAIYTYRLLSWFGPYLRLGLDSTLFPGQRIFGNDNTRDVLIVDKDENFLQRYLHPHELRLADSFDPMELKEGVGVSFDLSPSLLLDLHLRVGFGARQYQVRSLLIQLPQANCDSSGDGTICYRYQRQDSSSLLGLESTLIASVRLSRWVAIDTELDSIVPLFSTGAERPFDNSVINWRNTVSLRLVSFALVAYVTRMDLNPQLTNSHNWQVEQRILLRFTFDIL